MRLNTHSSEPDAAKPPGGFRRWLVLGVCALLALGAGVWCLTSINRQSDDFAARNGEWDGRPMFVQTTYPKISLPANAGLATRVFFAWHEFWMRHGKKNPARASFPPAQDQRCSVHGLLNQCMEMTGTRYLIAMEAAAAAVEFGHTNTLNGAQWAAAFEHTLEATPTDCYDRTSRRLRRDSLLLIRERPGLIKVVPRSRLTDYQKAGLVNRAYVPPKE